MTLQELIKYLPFIQAASEGKTIQATVAGIAWFDLNCEPINRYAVDQLRIKPATTLRPWTAEEVPVGALIRSKLTHQEFIIMGRNGWLANSVEISAVNTVRGGWQIFSTEGCEFSTDHGRTWLPCGV